MCDNFDKSDDRNVILNRQSHRLKQNNAAAKADNMASHLSRFNGKVVVCTGATKGIGFATAKRLGEEGARVVVSSRKQDNVDDAVSKLKALNIEATGVACHQGQSQDRTMLLQHAVKTYGGIDLLFANAGVNPHKGSFLTVSGVEKGKTTALWQVSEEQWNKAFDINLKSVFLLIKEVLPYMEQRGSGAIVTNSTANTYVLDSIPASMISVYAISKLAQTSLVKVLAEPCAEKNVRINAIAPGTIKTDFLSGVFPGEEDFADELGRTYARFLKRVGNAEECAGVVAFLLSQDASYITGDCITVCGGFTQRL